MSEYLMLAHTFEPDRYGIGGWLVSEKLDGQRAFWDGGISRGKLKADIPYANCAKDDRYVKEQVATGLWTRYGNVIHAPDWWLDELPVGRCLDGELYSRVLTREELFSTTSKLPGKDYINDWQFVYYFTFDIPSYKLFGSYRSINNPNHTATIKPNELELPKDSLILDGYQVPIVLETLQNDIIKPVQQTRLPLNNNKAEQEARKLLTAIAERGGEGIMIRNPARIWEPERTRFLLKLKKLDDHEGEILGFNTGRRTNKDSKYLGMMGNLVLTTNGPKGSVIFELSGFTDEERRISNPELRKWALENPDSLVEHCGPNGMFQRHQKISFTHRGWTADGKPMEARYLRR